MLTFAHKIQTCLHKILTSAQKMQLSANLWPQKKTILCTKKC